MKVEHDMRGRGYDGPRRHHHSRRQRSANVTQGIAPYYGESSGSVESLPRQHHHRPSSVASVGAWIKAKSADWFNPTDPFGAMTMYLQSMKHMRDRRSHRHRRRRHHHEVEGYPPEEVRHHRHRHHHRRREEFAPDVMIANARRQYEDDAVSQPTYPHRSRRSSQYYEEEIQPEDVEMDERGQSSSFSDVQVKQMRRKKRRSESVFGNELQRRDRVVVVCFIVVNVLMAAVGIGTAVLSGLAVWQPDAYTRLYKSEVTRLFADMMSPKIQNKCGTGFSKFSLLPAVILPNAFQAIFYAGIALTVVSIYALFIPLIASRSPHLHPLHVVLHIFYILAMLAFTGVIASYLCIYFQNIDSIEANMRLNAKSNYINKFKGNPMQTCDPISNFVNFIHRYFRCCGVDDGHDFEDPDLVPDFDGTAVDDGKIYAPDDDRPKHRVPLSCCRLGRYYDVPNTTTSEPDAPRIGKTTPRTVSFRGKKPRGWMIDLCRRVDSPLYGFSDRTSYMRIGCWPIVKEFFAQPVQIGLITLGVFCLILLFAATLSFLQTRLC